MTKLVLNLRGISDVILRSNFQRLLEFFRSDHQLVGFRHLELEFTAAVTNFRVPHNLGYQPKDVIETLKTGAGTVTWNYDLFDRTELDITVSGACRVRAFVGTYQEVL